ncbi:MAG: RNA 2',3'-cyclic phosphodiesterase [Thermoplasmata archaeon]|nr:RNA 2',3'-cyclic phosphodiesterase [Thermoplasmata archaeon]
MRAFVAVEVPPTLDAEIEPARSAPDHLTLRFLGDVDERTIEELIRVLAPSVASFAPFEFVLEGVGAFPSTDRPRVVWRGVSRGEAELRSLALGVRTAIRSAGGGDDPAPFVPHVTLFRVRSPRDRERAARLFAANASIPPPTVVPVRSVEFVESELTSAGARHRTRASFPLLGPTD